MDLDSFLVAVYVLVDDWWHGQGAAARRGPGRPAVLSMSEVLTLALVAQWPRWRSERDFWRFAQAHLRAYFPALGSQSQFNRRVRAAEPALRALHAAVATQLGAPHAAYHVLDTTLIPAIVRVRACRHGLFAGQASFGRCVSKTEWVYGFKVALSVTPAGVISSFGLAPAACDERPIGDALIAADGHDAYLADKGYASVPWERHWHTTYGALVAATPNANTRRAWPEAVDRWAASHRQIVEQVIAQLKDLFALERHRAKTLGGLLARLAAKVTAFTTGEWLNAQCGRPLRHLAGLLV
jgi:Transposase DDE domain